VKEEAIGDEMAQEGSHTRPRGGQALDEAEESPGQGEPMPEVEGGGESTGEQVDQTSDDAGTVEEWSFQLNKLRLRGGSSAWVSASE